MIFTTNSPVETESVGAALAKVLKPGTVIGRRTSVYPQVSVRGVVAEDHIVKSDTLSVRRR